MTFCIAKSVVMHPTAGMDGACQNKITHQPAMSTGTTSDIATQHLQGNRRGKEKMKWPAQRVSKPSEARRARGGHGARVRDGLIFHEALNQGTRRPRKASKRLSGQRVKKGNHSLHHSRRLRTEPAAQQAGCSTPKQGIRKEFGRRGRSVCEVVPQLS